MSEKGSERPLDTLEDNVGEMVTVHLKSGETYLGELAGYDQHLNVVLTGDEPDLDEAAREVTGATSVEGTLIIRGDNLVSLDIGV